MSDETETESATEETVENLRTRNFALERELRDARQSHEQRVMRAELKAEAVRAGMVDLDGLKLVDLEGVKMNDAGEVEGAAMLMSRLKRAKPWLFGHPNSSSSATPPPSAPPKQKLATEMTDDEWRAARAEMLRRK